MTTDAPALPEQVDSVLLDAGGVLLDLDYAYLRRLLKAHEYVATEQELARQEAIARVQINRHVADGGTVADAWRDYFHAILGGSGVPADARDSIIDSLRQAHERVGLWTVAIEEGPATVARLKADGYRIGVVSNAEGQVARDLDEAGYRGLFEIVVDSHIVGIEKPDPAIFRIAMDKMKIRPESAVFVGDVPAVDVEGARAAGITPILLDRFGLFEEWNVLRLKSTQELPALLAGSS